MKQIRNMIEIDEEKCNGCGLCINGCKENALAIVDGKARLVRESYCDGLGHCLGDCPQGALRIVQKEAEVYEPQASLPESLKCGCPGTLAREITPCGSGISSATSELTQWPVQLHLVPVDAPYWKNAELLVSADCVPFAYGNFHHDFLKGKRLVIACPKLDEVGEYAIKLSEIIRRNGISKVTVVRMEVPCCAGIDSITRQAVTDAGTGIEVHTVIVGLDGKIIT